MPCWSSSWATSCACGCGSVKLTSPARCCGRRAEDREAVDFLQPFVRVSDQFVLVPLDGVDARVVEIVDRRAERDGRGDRRRARLELRRQLGRREPIEIHAVDHAAAAQERRHRVEQLFAAVEHADARGAEHLVAAERQEVGAERDHVGRPMRHALSRVDQHDRPGRVRPPRDLRPPD